MVSIFLSRSVKIVVFFLAFFVAVIIVGILEATAKSGSATSNSTMTATNGAMAAKNGTRSAHSLRMVIVVSRHGNTGAVSDYPDDPYPLSDAGYWPFGSNQLTSQGRVQMYKLGDRLRRLYNGLLSETYTPREVRAASTPVDTVVLSGQMFLAGLFPPRGDLPWYKLVAWQPVPVYADSPDNSVKIINGGCDFFTEAAAATEAEFSDTYADNVTNITDYVKAATGHNITGLSSVRDLYNKLISEVAEGFTDLPPWAENIYPHLHPLFSIERTITFINRPEMARLLMGDFLRSLLDVMEGKINGSLPQVLHFYSGHVSTLLGLQVVLGEPRSSLVTDIQPGSALVLELHENTTISQYNLQVMYMDGALPDVEPVTLTLAGCGEPCDFHTFVNSKRSLYTVDFAKECQLVSSTH